MKMVPSPDQTDLWKNRRRIAYYSLSGLFLILFVAFTKELSDANADLVNGVAYTFGAVVITYMGGVVVDAVTKRRSDVASDIAGVPRTAAGKRRETASDVADRQAARHPAMEGD